VSDAPNDLKPKLLLLRLNYKAKSLVSKLSLPKMDCCETLCDHLLAEIKLTPRALRYRFLQATKRTDESYTLLSSRLANLLMYCLRSRGALDDAKKKYELMIADKLKDVLPSNVLHYVLSLEGDNCFTPSKIASSADIYSSNHNEKVIFAVIFSLTSFLVAWTTILALKILVDFIATHPLHIAINLMHFYSRILGIKL
jgi:hypothetical protein